MATLVSRLRQRGVGLRMDLDLVYRLLGYYFTFLSLISPQPVQHLFSKVPNWRVPASQYYL